jgi:uncharacterized membrane protein
MTGAPLNRITGSPPIGAGLGLTRAGPPVSHITDPFGVGCAWRGGLPRRPAPDGASIDASPGPIQITLRPGPVAGAVDPGRQAMIDLSHIHPMLVHFPIVLLMLAAALDIGVVLRGGDLGAGQFMARAAAWALGLGALAAAAAAIFGDVALDHALARGFPTAPLEQHGDLGMTTMWIFIVLAALRLAARWRHIPLAGWRGRGLALASVGGMCLLLATAYFGGALVYDIGVNVASVKP